MITKGNTIKLCENGKKSLITTQEILDMGFEDSDVTELLQDGLIIENYEGKYSISKELIREYIGMLLSYGYEGEVLTYIKNILLQARGGLILGHLTEQEQTSLIEHTAEEKNLEIFPIFQNDEESTVLAYRDVQPSINKYKGKLVGEAKKTFNNQDYMMYIEIYKTLLANDPTNPLYYFKIGSAYGILENYSEAIEYLTIANGLVKRHQLTKPCVDMILKGFQKKLEKTKNKIH